jgi:hypothetical protein
MTTRTDPDNIDSTIAAIVSAYRSRRPIDRIRAKGQPIADAAATSVLRPMIPAGIWHWFQPPLQRETITQYARRAARFAAARIAEVGYRVPAGLHHEDSERIGAMSGYGVGQGPRTVDRLERACSKEHGQ